MGFRDWFRNKQRTEQYITPDPDTVQWDPETGLPIGLKGPPKGNDVFRYQWRAKEEAARHNARARADARAYLDQGARISESFRPGGYAGTVGSGLYQARSALAASDQIEEQDVLAGWRNDEAFRARKRARKAGLLSLGGQLAGSALSMIPGGQVAGQALSQGVDNYANSINQPPGAPPPGGADRPAQARIGYDQPIGPPGSAMAPQYQNPGALGPGQEGPPAPGYGDRPQVGGPPPEEIGAGEGGDTPMSGGGGMAQAGGVSPYFLAETLHFQNTDDGFYDGLDLAINDALASRMADYGVMS